MKQGDPGVMEGPCGTGHQEKRGTYCPLGSAAGVWPRQITLSRRGQIQNGVGTALKHFYIPKLLTQNLTFHS